MAMQSGREIPTQAERYGDGIGSGNSRDHDQEQGMKENEVARQRSPFGAMVEDFSPVWFAICMNSGILSILCHQLPYQFNGLGIISTIFYVIDIVLFIIFSILFILRLILHFRGVTHSFSTNVQELAYLACWPIAWLTLCATTALIVSEAHWGAHAFTLVSYVMWWFGAFWTFSTSIVVYYTLFRNKMVHMESLAPGIIVPAVGVATVASTGGLIANYAYNISPGLQIPIVIVAYVLLGQGVFLALMVYASLINHYMTYGFPPGMQLPGLILLMGPTGQCATALVLLGTCADGNAAFAGYNTGPFISAAAAPGLYPASTMLALLLFGFGCFLLVISLAAICEGIVKREIGWSMTFWSTIFPMGTMNTAMLLFAGAMDSPAWRVLTTALLIILVIDYLVCWGYTLYNIIWGDLLIPKDARRGRKAD